MHDGICRGSSKRGEKQEALSCALELADFLLAFCSSSSACKFNFTTLISVLYRELSDLRTFVKHLSSVVDCHEMTNSAQKRGQKRLDLNGFENGDRGVLYKNPIEGLCRQLQLA